MGHPCVFAMVPFSDLTGTKRRVNRKTPIGVHPCHEEKPSVNDVPQTDKENAAAPATPFSFQRLKFNLFRLQVQSRPSIEYLAGFNSSFLPPDKRGFFFFLKAHFLPTPWLNPFWFRKSDAKAALSARFATARIPACNLLILP